MSTAHEKMLAAIAATDGMRKKRGNSPLRTKLVSAGDVIIPILIDEGASFDGTKFIWPNGRTTIPFKQSGYLKVGKKVGGMVASFGVARFVCWKHHGPPPPDRPFVDHINRVRDDNRPENLRWVSAQENNYNVVSRDRWFQRAAGRLPLKQTTLHAKLTYALAEEIRMVYATHRFSETELAKKYGVCRTTIHRIILRDSWPDEATAERTQQRQRSSLRLAEEFRQSVAV